MQPMTRRHLLQWAGFSAATLVLPVGCSAGGRDDKKEEKKGGGDKEGKGGDDKSGDTYEFKLPALPYATDALERSIDATRKWRECMRIELIRDSFLPLKRF